jgi:hypothetical protein
MRKGDYPKGDSDGVKRATKDAILKIVQNGKAKNRTTADYLLEARARLNDKLLVWALNTGLSAPPYH